MKNGIMEHWNIGIMGLINGKKWNTGNLE